MTTKLKARDSKHLYIGLMSGTSADGVDAALVNFSDDVPELVDFIDHPLPRPLKQRLVELNLQDTLTLEALCKLEHDVAEAFIEATRTLLESTGIQPEQVRAIGSHGQTLFHAPNIPMSLQVGHPAFIAKACGIDTAADFRIDDLAVGGQGAPLAPAFHSVLFQQSAPFFVVNIGGIANISHLNPAKGQRIGFDSGPGNALMDEFCKEFFECDYDRDGAIAARGKVNAPILDALLTHPYFKAPYPKSTGRETFNRHWLHPLLKTHTLAPEDWMATLCELTASTIAQGIRQVQDNPNGVLWVVGGGAFNPELMRRLQANLPDMQVQSSQQAGHNPNAVEAMLCAWLAKQRIENRPVALRTITGAEKDVVLGGLWSKH